MMTDGEEVRSALVTQWRALAAAVPSVDLDLPSRVDGWRNSDVLAHLYIQPILLGRFLETMSAQRPTVDVTANLAGTGSFCELIDTSARRGAELGKWDFAVPLEGVLPTLVAADLAMTVTTLQGSIGLVDYLVTRCVEGVVHGQDLVGPVEPDPAAQAIAGNALLELLASKAPHLVREAQRLPLSLWIDVATGRHMPPPSLASAVPVMR